MLRKSVVSGDGVPHLAECDVVCVHTGQVLQGSPGDGHTPLVNLLSSYFTIDIIYKVMLTLI